MGFEIVWCFQGTDTGDGIGHGFYRGLGHVSIQHFMLFYQDVLVSEVERLAKNTTSSVFCWTKETRREASSRGEAPHWDLDACSAAVSASIGRLP